MANAYKFSFLGNKIIKTSEANISITSSAVLYGLSVYTVFAVCISKDAKRYAFRLDEHFKRLCNSARIVGIDTFESEWSYEKFEKTVKELVTKNDINEDVFVRATVHVVSEIAGTRSRGLETKLSIFIYDASTILPKEGGRLKTSVWRRIPDYVIPSRAKVNGAYVNSVLAKQDALDSGYDDCVFLDAHGHVCELSAANIFIVRNGQLITPDTTSDLLEGINRSSVIETAREDFNIEVVERSVDLTELYIADEVFASGTSANVASIHEIDGRKVADGKTGEITKKIQKAHYDLLHGNYPD
ncbi:MAG: aminotransferase class IV, partial [bacterium]|nr:aminotransferase class IV [bacterium]